MIPEEGEEDLFLPVTKVDGIKVINTQSLKKGAMGFEDNQSYTLVKRIHETPWNFVSEIHKKTLYINIIKKIGTVLFAFVVGIVLMSLLSIYVINRLIFLTKIASVNNQELNNKLDEKNKQLNELNAVLDIKNKALDAKVVNRTNEIRNLEKNINTTLEFIQDAVIFTDSEGKIVGANPIAEKMLGYKFSKLRDKYIDSMLSIRNVGSDVIVENLVREFLVISEVIEIRNKLILVSNDQTQYRINLSCAPVLDDGYDLIGAVLVFRDTTEEQYLNEKISHISKMDALGQLASGVAHDFNNVLSSINMSAEYIEMVTDVDVLTGSSLANIKDSVTQASQLTKKLLAFNRKSTMVYEQIDVLDIMNNSINILKSTINKKIKIKFKDNCKHYNLSGDKHALTNMILNLGINASHAIEEKLKSVDENKSNGCSFIQFEIQNTYIDDNIYSERIDKLATGEYIEIRIRDNGIGINKQYINKIFEPFYTQNEMSHGLGLSLVYNTILQHNGTITVDSEVNEGSLFQVLIPCQKAFSLINESESLPSLMYNTASILIVEDEPSIRNTLSMMLSNLGHNVLMAENGKKAVEVYRQNFEIIDLIIMDMIMPEMNGKEAFMEMKEINSDCLVLIASGFIKESDIQEMKNLGVVEMIKKPYRLKHLETLIKTTLVHSDNKISTWS